MGLRTPDEAAGRGTPDLIFKLFYPYEHGMVSADEYHPAPRRMRRTYPADFRVELLLLFLYGPLSLCEAQF